MRDLGQRGGGVASGGLCLWEPGSLGGWECEAELGNGAGAVEGARTPVLESDCNCQLVYSRTELLTHRFMYKHGELRVLAVLGARLCPPRAPGDSDIKILELSE